MGVSKTALETSNKQFKWFEIYYNIYSGIGDIEPEPF
jgi:hypothetical protein